MFDDGVFTESSAEQTLLIEKIAQLRSEILDERLTFDDERLRLLREEHVHYLQSSIQKLPAGFIALDAARAWMMYWLLHSLSLLDAPLPEGVTKQGVTAIAQLLRGTSVQPSCELEQRVLNVAEFIAACQDADGGFAGGPGQFAHLAPTYASVLNLVTLGGEHAFQTVNRNKLWSFLLRMARPPSQGGGFSTCQGGEVDVRGCYLTMAVAHILNLDKATLAEHAGLVSYIQQCQTYEGGLGGAPGNEAHGGYTYCGLAALMLIDQADVLDLPSLLRWLVSRQGWFEGGFMGRTNKLVDGCYSFWQAGLFPLIQRLQPQLLRQTGNPATPHGLLRSAFGLATAPVRLVAGGFARLGSLGKRGSPSDTAGGSEGRPDQPSTSCPELPPVTASSLEELLGSSPETAFLYKISAVGICRELEAPSPPLEEAALAGGAHTADSLQGPALTVSEEASLRPVESEDEPSSAALPDPPASRAPFSAPEPTSSGAAAADDSDSSSSSPLFDATALQLWLLLSCQVDRGGMRDKPGKPRDFYHTCYCLAGLSVCQHHSGIVLGGPDNLLAPMDPLLCVVQSRVSPALDYFSAQPRIP